MSPPWTDAGADGGTRIWGTGASCRLRDADLWFTRWSWPTATAVCGACPVLEPCLAAVPHRERNLPRGHRQGIVAGLTGPQRHALERAKDRRPRREPPPTAPAKPLPPPPPRARIAPCGTRMLSAERVSALPFGDR